MRKLDMTVIKKIRERELHQKAKR